MTTDGPRMPGKAALDALCKGRRQEGRPLLFLDLDDVVCVGPYGGYHVPLPKAAQPADLWERLWHPPAVAVLLTVIRDRQPEVILTSSWLRLMERDGFQVLFRRTGLGAVAESLHAAWEAPQDRGLTRRQAIEKWLHANYVGQSLVVLDDELSGTGLRGSALDRAGCVVLCEAGVGLHVGHLPAIGRALAPCKSSGLLSDARSLP